jgi:hypothetical protein
MTKTVKWATDHFWHLLSGIVAASIGYFEPINGIICLMSASIFVDFVVGIWVAYRLGCAIQSKKMWRTLEKWLVCLVIVMLCYSAYIELGGVRIYILAGWAVFGFELWSILESLSKIKDGRIFKVLKKIMEVNFEKKTGVKLDDKE